MRELFMKTWKAIFFDTSREMDWWNRKLELMNQRHAQILEISGYGKVYRLLNLSRSRRHVEYMIHLSYFIRQGSHYYIEEEILPFKAILHGSDRIEHSLLLPPAPAESQSLFSPETTAQLNNSHTRSFEYNRRKAVQYAERWWNDYNPAFPKFEVDCTNFVSQCLYAGNAPMRGYPDRSRGWWCKNNNWSYSWSVAHALRWYLSSSDQGLTAKEVTSANKLSLGDVICYDFEGDGKWNHNTIVTAKDAQGEPLVNAHTTNSRHRYWSYEDSYAWTPKCQYKFFKIGE